PSAGASLCTDDPDVRARAAEYLAIIGLAYPLLGVGLNLASAFQGAARPLWPLVGITCRAAIVAVGGWIAIHVAGAGLPGLAVAAATGLTVYSAIQVIAFRRWQADLLTNGSIGAG